MHNMERHGKHTPVHTRLGIMLKMVWATRDYLAASDHRCHHAQIWRFGYNMLLEVSSRSSIDFSIPVNVRVSARASMSRHPIPSITVEPPSYLACRKRVFDHTSHWFVGSLLSATSVSKRHGQLAHCRQLNDMSHEAREATATARCVHLGPPNPAGV